MFMSQRPYLPAGTLRAALVYPAPVSAFPDEAFDAALERMALAHLSPELDRSRRWDRELSSDEQQKLPFARLLLHRPRWILINEALNSLDEENRALALDIFTLELADAAILNLGRADMQKGFFTRVLHLIDDPTGERLAIDAHLIKPPPPTVASATSAGLHQLRRRAEPDSGVESMRKQGKCSGIRGG